ncbi:receptor-like protein 12 [Prunus avium]|uniref:Receptor-like protein 12 n=1 Tax=Prunus avium TaxID=42229 RepID=A0A6P5SRQ0_PRUAV|nr:receptor-like protein 12 [Prunus avium]
MKGDGRCLKLFLALLILFLQNVKGGEVGHNHSHSHSLKDAKVTVRCIARERQALLAFKRGLVDEFNQLSTWGSEAQKQDCCRWEGVYCSNQTGHVIQLDLGYSFPGKIFQPDIFGYSFQGKMISPKLIELQHLQYLDLTLIDFNGIQIPDFIGSLTNLRYLNLSFCQMVGQIPSSFRNLTQLQHLDLAYNWRLQAENLNWLPALSSLTYLDLSLINFNGSQIPDFIGSLTNLRNLSLSYCNLVGQIPSSFGNLTHLTDLDLSRNFNGSQIPNFIGSLTNLRNLRLSSCHFIGPIPSSFGNLMQLQNLHLSYNQLQPENLNCLPALSSLTDLDLSGNFNGSQIPDFIGSLTNLRNLRLSSCNLVGQIPSSFGNLTQLQHLDLSYNQLQLENLNWLPALSSLTDLDLSRNNLSLPPPPTPILSTTLYKTNSSTSLAYVYLSDNHLTSSIFLWLSNYSLATLELSNNNLSGFIPDFLGNMSSLEYLGLSDNQIEGANPNSFARLCNL